MARSRPRRPGGRSQARTRRTADLSVRSNLRRNSASRSVRTRAATTVSVATLLPPVQASHPAHVRRLLSAGLRSRSESQGPNPALRLPPADKAGGPADRAGRRTNGYESACRRRTGRAQQAPGALAPLAEQAPGRAPPVLPRGTTRDSHHCPPPDAAHRLRSEPDEAGADLRLAIRSRRPARPQPRSRSATKEPSSTGSRTIGIGEARSRRHWSAQPPESCRSPIAGLA
jgi:hypothetical protein